MATASDYSNGRPWGHRRRKFTPRVAPDGAVRRPMGVRRHEPDDPTLLAPRAFRVAGLLHAALLRAAQRLGLHVSVAEVLLAFSEVAMAQRPSDVARRTGRSRPACSRALDRAEAVGLVLRRPCRWSDREIEVVLTELGRTRLEALERSWLDELDAEHDTNRTGTLGAALRTDTAVGPALQRLEDRLVSHWDDFRHAATSSKWRSARWTEMVDEYPE